MIKNIDYFSIIKEAINITKRNKTLWLFGLLSIFGGSGFSFRYNFPSSSSNEKSFDKTEYASLFRKISFYWENYTEWIILGIVLLLVIIMGLYLLGLIGNGALIDAIFKDIKNEKVTFSLGFKRGVGFLKRFFLLEFLFIFSFLVFLAILIFPVVRLFILESYGAGIFLGVVAFILLISISILVFYLRKYAQMYLVGGDLGVVNSIKLAYRLFEKNIKESIIMGLVVMAVGLVIGVGMVFVIMLVFIPGGLAGMLVYKLVGKIALIVLILIAGLLMVSVFILVSAILNVFSQAVWILFFNQIAKKELPAEEEIIQESVTKIIKDSEVEPNIS